MRLVAEPLKNSFGLEVIERIAGDIAAVHPAFPRREFVAMASDEFLDLELTGRARHIAAALAATLPSDRAEALGILEASLGPPLGDREAEGMASFVYLPHVYFVAAHGLDHFEEAMSFQYEVTRRFTAEFSIRAFLEAHTERTLGRLREWTVDPDMHVRRLVSEGTRPRLPWAPRLQRFIEDPSPVVDLLERLKDDPAEYVRRSVANNLNDISKDHPDLVVDIARRWLDEPDRRRLVRHGLRTLVKQGHERALAALCYTTRDGIEVEEFVVAPAEVPVGGKTTVRALLTNRASSPRAALVDFRVHFVRRSGSSPKVFKGKEAEVGPGGRIEVKKTVSVAHHTTRTPYPGAHRVELMINGEVVAATRFEVTEDNSSQ
jgi:3-methyladenine DNA glycosylase AlkC